ncbi:non-homologous end-joining DNA ligase [Haloflavibacter putidus]|uniref:DNA ligase (ATP) n=1 Tax=Haloflavibacter putidus TaxID=2576776 RepID=A0A507ZVR4_9FLAO|nr:non-homologous end-joining DNA ligase [Haloflavibacter putidus]TQD38865.1 ATP-dependent DNA ligase [Haloflavibacter putidus]
MHELLKNLPEAQQKKLQKEKQPEFITPMKAKLTHKRFSDKDWVFERKLDGERVLIVKNKKEVNLFSRNEKKLNFKYPQLVAAFKKQRNSFIADGEIVAFKGNVTSFARLQKRMHVSSEEEAKKSSVKVYCYVFDLLFLEGYNLCNLSFNFRKNLLRKAFNFQNPIRFTPHKNENGKKFIQEACKKNWEGLIAKKRDSTYVHSRSSNWLKFKCVHEQEFVIGGYTKPQGERIGFGALLIGFYKGEDLYYASKVGTGYDDETLEFLHDKMKNLEVENPPFVQEDALPQKDVFWLKPKLVAEVGFTEWTNNNKLRHPRYIGLRDDKKAKEVVKEA